MLPSKRLKFMDCICKLPRLSIVSVGNTVLHVSHRTGELRKVELLRRQELQSEKDNRSKNLDSTQRESRDLQTVNQPEPALGKGSKSRSRNPSTEGGN